MSIYTSIYKNQPGITLESEVIKAQFLPDIGSKMSSLVYKPLGRDLLVHAPDDTYRMQPFDGHYESGECSGFDEMFPTIDVCHYESFPWQGTKLADHGEVWSLRWTHHIADDRLHMSTYGVRFPYKLAKEVFFSTPHILTTYYTLTNLSDFDFDFLWAAHPMIVIEDDVELVLPAGIHEVINVSASGPLGGHGNAVTWPTFTRTDGREQDLRRLQPQSAGEAYKYYVRGKIPEGWCALKYHQSRFSLALSFPAETVPYLAILPNEGGWRDMHNIFLEPATSSFDRLDAARLRREYSTVKARATYEWHLNITLSDKTDFQSVNVNGELV